MVARADPVGSDLEVSPRNFDLTAHVADLRVVRARKDDAAIDHADLPRRFIVGGRRRLPADVEREPEFILAATQPERPQALDDVHPKRADTEFVDARA